MSVYVNYLAFYHGFRRQNESTAEYIRRCKREFNATHCPYCGRKNNTGKLCDKHQEVFNGKSGQTGT